MHEAKALNLPKSNKRLVLCCTNPLDLLSRVSHCNRHTTSIISTVVVPHQNYESLRSHSLGHRHARYCQGHSLRSRHHQCQLIRRAPCPRPSPSDLPSSLLPPHS